MDPISQGTVAALLPQTVLSRENIRWFTLCGLCAGLAPDLDILINSSEDPLLFLTYHRQFTHALVFIPIGALCVASFLWLVLRKKLNFKQIYLACLLGYTTHGFLDACTTYGTQLFWPFSDYRVAWNNISIIDPLFTIPLVLAVIVGVVSRKRWVSITGVTWLVVYLTFGFIQNYRAEQATLALARSHGHETNELSVQASFGNNLVWKAIYEDKGTYHVNAIQVGIGSEPQVCGTASQATKLNIPLHYPWLTESQQLTDVHRFTWFSQGYVGLDENDPNRVIDIRYSTIPNRVDGFWGIKLDRNAPPDQHVLYATNERVDPGAPTTLWNYINGIGCRPLSEVVG